MSTMMGWNNNVNTGNIGNNLGNAVNGRRVPGHLYPLRNPGMIGFRKNDNANNHV